MNVRIIYMAILIIPLAYIVIAAADFEFLKSHLVCRGSFASERSVDTSEVFIKIRKHRWPFSGQTDAAMWIEIPNEHVWWYDDLRLVGDQYQIFGREIDPQSLSGKSNMVGNYSEFSKSLAIQVGGDLFEGSCQSL
jgi:hypothetical protein